MIDALIILVMFLVGVPFTIAMVVLVVMGIPLGILYGYILFIERKERSDG